MEDNITFKKYFYEKKYNECVLLLKNKVTNFVVSQIQAIDSTFDFTTVSDLIAASDFYLKDGTIAQKLQIALTQEDLLEQIQLLLLICEAHGISK